MSPETAIPVPQSGATNDPAPVGDPIDPSSALESSKRPVARAAVMLIVLAAAVAAVQLSPARMLIQDTVRVRQVVERLGPFAYPVCLLVSAILIGSGFPRLILCAAASMIFGFGWGLFLTQGGALLGYYVVFCFIRWGGGDWVTHKRPRLRAIAETIQDQGVVGVILARQIPIHGTLVNLCLGLSRVKHRHFLIGTAIGLLPEAIPVALVGAGLVRSSLKESAGVLGLAVVAFLCLWIGSAWALRRLRNRR
ncbi:MAG TPA: VTT domain-containing protein, partial [Tepidisphaeraceae bacterium]